MVTSAVGAGSSPSAMILPPQIWLTNFPSFARLRQEFTSGKLSRNREHASQVRTNGRASEEHSARLILPDQIR